MQTVSTSEPNWEKIVEAFAKEQVPFVVLDFNYGRHFIIYEMLRENYGLKGHVDRGMKKAFFEPGK